MRTRQAKKAAQILQKVYDKQYNDTFLRGADKHLYRDIDIMQPPNPLTKFKNMVAHCAYEDAMAQRKEMVAEILSDAN